MLVILNIMIGNTQLVVIGKAELSGFSVKSYAINRKIFSMKRNIIAF
jgi:hypothetical protein